MRIIKRLAIVLVLLLLAIQVVRPEKTNPIIDPERTIQARTQMSPQVSAIIERSCQDCHTYKTVWPWYSQVAPMSWLVASDVNEGREHLSLSDWANYDKKKAISKLDEICEEVSEGAMPLPTYTVLHPEAKLTEEEKRILCDWVKEEVRRIETAGL